MRKIEGLKFLQKNFPTICVDCVFVTKEEPLDSKALSEHSAQLYRVRSGRRSGSELDSPQKTCHSAGEVESFVSEMLAIDNSLEFVVHRVTKAFFEPTFLGTIALFEGCSPLMMIDFQAVSRALVADMDRGLRPRDWKVVCTFTYSLLGMSPIVHLADIDFPPESIKNALYKLWRVGRDISSLKESLCDRVSETVTRFNVYPTGAILLDDHRAVESFITKR